MNKTFLIIKHEFLNMIKRPGFIIMTLAVPVIALLAIGVYQIVSTIEAPPAQQIKIGYVDDYGGFTGYTEQGNVTLIPYDIQEEATGALVNNDIVEYFIIPADYLSTGIINRYTMERQLEAPSQNTSAIRDFLLSNLLSDNSTEVIGRAKAPLNLVSTRLTETGAVAPEQGGYETFIIPYIFSLLLVVSIFFSSGYLLQGLGEEKENRIMEILLSSISTRQLLTGKVLGLGAAGLLQIIVWLGSASILLNVASSAFGGFISTIRIPPDFLILGIIYFILGYLLFAVLSAGIGAVSPTAREGQQISAIFSMFAIIPIYFIIFLSQSPNNPISTVLTLIPITAPVTVMARLGFSDVATWELIVSISIMVLFIVGGLWLAAKIFRIYLLMYGKRPGLREIARNIRNT